MRVFLDICEFDVLLDLHKVGDDAFERLWSIAIPASCLHTSQPKKRRRKKKPKQAQSTKHNLRALRKPIMSATISFYKKIKGKTKTDVKLFKRWASPQRSGNPQ